MSRLQSLRMIEAPRAYLVLEDGEDPVPPFDIVLAIEVELQVPGREGRLGALDLEQARTGSADGLLEVVGDLDGDGQDGRTRRLGRGGHFLQQSSREEKVWSEEERRSCLCVCRPKKCGTVRAGSEREPTR